VLVVIDGLDGSGKSTQALLVCGRLARGGKTLAERAADRVTQLLETHVPVPLEPDAAERVRRIIERAAAKPAAAGAGGGAPDA